MSNLLFRDKKKRHLYSHYELKRVEYKNIINNLTLSKEIRARNLTLLNELPRNSSKARTKNRCILTGRGHSVLKFCKLSRIKFRELASQGLLGGVTKSSW